MNSLCKQYISEVKLLLPAIGKSEKNYLASLTSNLEDFCDDTSPQTINDLYQKFGTPIDTVNSYISTLPTETLIKRIRKSKYLRYFIVTLIIMFACITFVFAITNYRSFQVFKQETVYFTNTDIKYGEKDFYEKKNYTMLNFYSIFIMLNSNFNESRYHL